MSGIRRAWVALWLWISLVPVVAAPPPGRLAIGLMQTKKKLEEVNLKEQQLARQLSMTQNSLQLCSSRMDEIQQALDSANQQHQGLRDKVLASRRTLGRKRQALAKRLREIEMQGSSNYLEVLFQARSFPQFIAYGEYVQRMLASERMLIQQIAAERSKFESHREAVQRTVNEIDVLRKEQMTQMQSLHQLKGKQTQIYTQLTRQRVQLQTRVVELEHLSAVMEKKLQGMLTSANFDLVPAIAGSGRFIWPVDAPITSPFGYRIHPIYGTGRFHSGLDLGAGFGTSIRAADNGVVVYSDWCGGYGQCVMIQHGQGLISLYGHCSQLFVKVGDQVRQGQAVAAVGSTGASTGPHLHFEVRQNDTAVDPRGFL